MPIGCRADQLVCRRCRRVHRQEHAVDGSGGSGCETWRWRRARRYTGAAKQLIKEPPPASRHRRGTVRSIAKEQTLNVHVRIAPALGLSQSHCEGKVA